MGGSWTVDVSQRGTSRRMGMGHDLKGDMDLIYYNYPSEEGLKRIYDRVMIVTKITSRKY